jgi:hypothetical protein
MYCECPLSSASYELVGAAKIDALDPDEAVHPESHREHASPNLRRRKPLSHTDERTVSMAFHPQLDEVRELQHPNDHSVELANGSWAKITNQQRYRDESFPSRTIWMQID